MNSEQHDVIGLIVMIIDSVFFKSFEVKVNDKVIGVTTSLDFFRRN